MESNFIYKDIKKDITEATLKKINMERYNSSETKSSCDYKIRIPIKCEISINDENEFLDGTITIIVKSSYLNDNEIDDIENDNEIANYLVEKISLLKNIIKNKNLLLNCSQITLIENIVNKETKIDFLYFVGFKKTIKDLIKNKKG
jgi:hypothetical protein